jgi:hypothetical protein
MSRWNATGDTPDIGAERSVFVGGVLHQAPPDRLPVGNYTRLVNGEIRRGYPESRRGTRKLTWMANTDGTPLVSNVQGIRWWRPIRQDGTAVDNGMVILIGDNDMWRCSPGNTPVKVMEDITTDDDPCEIIPCFNTALILRGEFLAPLIYDPYNTLYRGGGLLAQLTPAIGSVLPPSSTGCSSGGRVWLRYGRNKVIASDLYEFSYVATSVFTIDGEDDGEILRLWPYGRDNVLIFKTDGVFTLTSSTSDFSDLYREKVYGASGCLAGDSIAQIGTDIFYLSSGGIERLSVNGDSVLVQSTVPVSGPASGYFQGISSPSVRGARGLVVDNYYIISIPSAATLTQTASSPFYNSAQTYAADIVVGVDNLYVSFTEAAGTFSSNISKADADAAALASATTKATSFA